MSYKRGENLILDLLVDKMRRFIPGFYPGCELEITEEYGIPKYYGKIFKSCTNESNLQITVDAFEKNDPHWMLDPNNTFCINYRPRYVKVLTPRTDFEPHSATSVTVEALEEAIAKYIPGFYVGCELKIVRQPIVGKASIGDTFSTKGVSKMDLFAALTGMINKRTFILDPNNKFQANYGVKDLEVVLKEKSNAAEVTGYRVKTKEELIQEYGGLEGNVPGYFCVEMVKYCGKAIDPELAALIQKRGSAGGDLNSSDVLTFVGSFSRSFTFTPAMITNKPLPEKKVEDVPDLKKEQVLVFGKYKRGDIVVSLVNKGSLRVTNQMFEINQKSSENWLIYGKAEARSSDVSTWRLANPGEIEFYYSHLDKTNVILPSEPTKIDGYSVRRQQSGSFNPEKYHHSSADSTTEVKKSNSNAQNLVSDFVTIQLKSNKKRVKLSIN